MTVYWQVRVVEPSRIVHDYVRLWLFFFLRFISKPFTSQEVFQGQEEEGEGQIK